MSAAMPKNLRQPSRQEMPEREIAEYLTVNPSHMVDVQVRRLSVGTQVATLRGGNRLTFPLRCIAQLPGVIAEIWGGGRFIIKVRDHGAPIGENLLVPQWVETAEGQTRAIPDNVTFTVTHDAERDALVAVLVDAQGRFSPLIGGSVAATIASLMSGGASAVPGALPAGSAPAASGSAPQLPPIQYDPYGRPLAPPDVDWVKFPWDVRKGTVPEQWEWLKRAHQGFFPGAAQSNDTSAATQIAMGWQQREQAGGAQQQAANARLEAAFQNMQERLAATERAHAMQLQAERDGRAELERRLERERGEAQRKAEQQAFQAQLARLEDKLSLQQQAPQQRGPDYAALMTALAPIGVAWVQSQASQHQSAMQTQLESTKTLLATVTHREPPPPPAPSLAKEITPIIVAVAPILAPAIAQWLSNMDPSKVAELRSQSHGEQTIYLQMLTALIKEMAPADNMPWWAEPVMGLLQQAGGAAQAMALSAQAQVAQLPPGVGSAQPQQRTVEGQGAVVRERQAPQVVETRPVQQHEPAPAQATQPAAVGLDLDALLAALAQQDPQAAANTTLVFRAIIAQQPFDPSWLTHEWLVLVFNLHQKLEPEKLSELFLDHLSHCRAFGILPQAMSAVFDDPAAVLGEGLYRMPVGMVDRAYVERVIELIAEQIEVDERETDIETDADPAPNDESPDYVEEDENAVLDEEAAE